MASLNTDVDFSESRAIQINVIGWVCTGIAIATTSLKIFTRIEIVKQPGWDDVFIFFSLALSIIATALVSYSVTLGLGRHTAAVIVEHGMEGTIMTARWQIIAFPFNIGAFSFPNISIAILVSNLLDPNPPRTYALYAMSTVQVIFAIVSVFVVFLQCSPTDKLWNASLPGTCWDPSVFNDYSYWVSAYTTMTDIVLAIMPISAFWNLQMRFPKKLSVCIMMGLTLLSAIVTIVKATYLHLFTDKTDPLWNVVPLVNWGLIEQNVVIVAACIPTLRPFFRKTFQSKDASTSSGSGSRSGFGFQLTSNPKPVGCKHLPSVSELPLNEQEAYDVENNGDHRAIWRTKEVKVESETEDGDEGSIFGKYTRDGTRVSRAV
ncbi:uncharacterized protein ASPGLDRAFT_42285 [Aspergillus glaucus CBS 516.65]|uniref:Rhodopsin domain-containing protein n=1 Tax=Aspergillus glaucus CBS 516.65 TaxID=1160497 RepID=A0A1L9VXS1_ASPGL|nr:hypothetical protein ASPGLDRAFT_42285 [Aspergillus glaucus CBS 516.65]OJJ88711.1 hypothetical protein ASPGLDRAFT_42285 [Aspergillus glaucus CBS 516.65]